METRFVNEDIGQNSEPRVSESEEDPKDSDNLESLYDPTDPPCADAIDGIFLCFPLLSVVFEKLKTLNSTQLTWNSKL